MKYVIANWKMNGSYDLCGKITGVMEEVCKIRDSNSDSDGEGRRAQFIIAAPLVYGSHLMHMMEDSPVIDERSVQFASQDCSANAHGAYTGDVSAGMLRECGYSYAIIGHSERRAAHMERIEDMLDKVRCCCDAGITPIVCLGYVASDGGGGDDDNNGVGSVVLDEVDYLLSNIDASYCAEVMFAYEPVWAIGSGQVPREDVIRGSVVAIKAVAEKKYGVKPRVLYGGSVNSRNVGQLLGSIEELDGVLVGGASITQDEWYNLCIEAGKVLCD